MLKFHSISLETALLNIKCSNRSSVYAYMCVCICMSGVLWCVLYLAHTNNWNNLSKKSKITSDNLFFFFSFIFPPLFLSLLLLDYKDILYVNGPDSSLAHFGQYSVVQMSTQDLLALSSNSSACLCIVLWGTFCTLLLINL